MSALPSRDIAGQITKAFDVRGLAADRAGQAMRIVEAYASDRLKTLEEWIAVFNDVAASGYHETTQDVLDDMRIGGSDEK